MKKNYNPKFSPVYKSKSEDLSIQRVRDLLLYKNHYSPIRKNYTSIGTKDAEELSRNSSTNFST